jgi:hypothetical protein
VQVSYVVQSLVWPINQQAASLVKSEKFIYAEGCEVPNNIYWYKKEVDMMNRKGQAAMEFLMTYGWAILVVLIVIGALAYFGVLNPTRLLPPKCTFPTGINCRDFVVSATNNRIDLKVVNGMGRDIEITLINASPQAGNPSNSHCEIDYAGAGTPLLIRNGHDADIQIDCSAFTTLADSADAKYKWDLEMMYYYTDSGTAYEKTLVGELLTNIEP